MFRRAAGSRLPDTAWIRGTGAGWVTVLTGLVFAQGFGALAQIILARRVGAEDYGRYLACVGLASVLVAFVSLGLDQWLLASPSSTQEGIGRRFYSALRLRLPMIVGWLLALTLLTRVLPPATFPPTYLLLAGAAIACESTSLLAYAALRNRGLHGRVTLMQSAAAAAVLFSAIALPLAPGEAGLFLAARASIAAGLAIISVLVVRTSIGRKLPNLTPAREVTRDALPFMSSELAVAVYMRADLTILSLTKGVPAASIYGPATNLLSVCFLAPNALYLLVLPSLARLWRQSRQRYERLSRTQLAAQGLSGLLLFLGVFTLAPWLVQVVLGPGYAASAATLRLLSPILLFKSLSFGLGAMLTSQGRQRARTQVQIAVATLNVVGNVLVVGRFGVVGVAIVYVISEIALLAGYVLAEVWGRRQRAHTPEAALDENPDR